MAPTERELRDEVWVERRTKTEIGIAQTTEGDRIQMTTEGKVDGKERSR